MEVPSHFHPVELQPPKAKREKFPFEGFIDFQGIQIDVENKAGSERKGVSPSGKPWSTRMFSHYGEIRGTEGVDGDKLDVYVGPNHDASLVVVIHQYEPETGQYDEDKVMIGFDSVEEAIGAYKKQYDRPGFYREGEHTAMPIGQFWRWVQNRDNHGKKLHKDARKKVAARPIPIDKGMLASLVTEDLVPAIKRWLMKHPRPDQPIGNVQRITDEHIWISKVGGGEVQAEVLVAARKADKDNLPVIGASASRTGLITLVLNGAFTPNKLLGRDGDGVDFGFGSKYKHDYFQPLSGCKTFQCLPYGLYSHLIHEVTHVAEQHLSMGVPTYSPAEVREKGEEVWDSYVNDPMEVRAFMQEIVDQATDFARRYPDIKTRMDPQEWVGVLLTMSTTWGIIEKHLSSVGRRKILKALYSELAREGLLKTASARTAETIVPPGPFIDHVLNEKWSRIEAAAAADRPAGRPVKLLRVLADLLDPIAQRYGAKLQVVLSPGRPSGSFRWYFGTAKALQISYDSGPVEIAVRLGVFPETVQSALDSKTFRKELKTVLGHELIHVEQYRRQQATGFRSPGSRRDPGKSDAENYALYLSDPQEINAKAWNVVVDMIDEGYLSLRDLAEGNFPRQLSGETWRSYRDLPESVRKRLSRRVLDMLQSLRGDAEKHSAFWSSWWEQRDFEASDEERERAQEEFWEDWWRGVRKTAAAEETDQVEEEEDSEERRALYDMGPGIPSARYQRTYAKRGAAGPLSWTAIKEIVPERVDVPGSPGVSISQTTGRMIERINKWQATTPRNATYIIELLVDHYTVYYWPEGRTPNIQYLYSAPSVVTNAGTLQRRSGTRTKFVSLDAAKNAAERHYRSTVGPEEVTPEAKDPVALLKKLSPDQRGFLKTVDTWSLGSGVYSDYGTRSERPMRQWYARMKTSLGLLGLFDSGLTPLGRQVAALIPPLKEPYKYDYRDKTYRDKTAAPKTFSPEQIQDSYKPPKGAAAAARRGLDARKEWGRGGLSTSDAGKQGIGSGVQRATNLANGDNVDEETIRKMHAFFQRHEKNYKPDKKEADGGPTAGTIAWWLWGGDAGRTWAASMVKRLDAEKTKKAAVLDLEWVRGVEGGTAKRADITPNWVSGVRKWIKQVFRLRQYSSMDDLLGHLRELQHTQLNRFWEYLFYTKGLLPMGKDAFSEIHEALRQKVKADLEEARDVLSNEESRVSYIRDAMTPGTHAYKMDAGVITDFYKRKNPEDPHKAALEGFLESSAEALGKVEQILSGKLLRAIQTFLNKHFRNEVMGTPELLLKYNIGDVKLIYNDIRERQREQAPRDVRDLKEYIRYFVEAKALLERRGFGKLWYGPIFVSCASCGGENPYGKHFGVGAHYVIRRDHVVVFDNPRSGIVPLLIHELGHRYYYKFMSQGDRLRFDSYFKEVASVSEYGATASAEDFAEVFTHFVLGRDMTRDQIDRFKAFLAKEERGRIAESHPLPRGHLARLMGERRKRAALVQTDTATIYAVAPEQLQHIWEKHDRESVSAAEMDQALREHGGAVISTGRDGIFDVQVGVPKTG